MLFAVDPDRPSSMSHRLLFFSLFSSSHPSSISLSVIIYFVKEKMNVILMISDGWGPAAATLARTYSQKPLNIDPYLIGTVRTASSDRYT
jgi:hypothetical protein